MRRVPIQWRITALIFFIVSFSLLLMGLILISQLIESEENELREQAMLTARTVAELPTITEYIQNSNKDPLLKTVEQMRSINRADYIVVLDMNRTRLTHPVSEMLGTKSEGDDEGPAFAEHSYTSTGKGEIGTVIRALVPIMDQGHQQVGVVIAGFKLPGLWETLHSLKSVIFLTLGLSLVFGGWGAWLLARQIKKQMFQLEPHEIASLLVERTEAYNAINEGIIAIDKNETITIFNHRAKEMLDINEEVIGKEIRTVLPDTHLPEILNLDEAIYNKELQIRNLNILSNRVPIKVNGQTIGAIAVFKDITEVKELAEELTGVKAFVSALRVQNHEHMNKLHTIAGLIQVGNKEKALAYVFEVTEEQKELTQFLSKNIHDESLIGLLLSKVSRGKELGVQLMFDPRSKLTTFPTYMDHHDFVHILGNLIENAFDSFEGKSGEEEHELYVSILEKKEELSILVEDNGQGITEEVLPYIFKQGYSSKEADTRGIGLYIVEQLVKKGKGIIDVDSQVGKGTTFMITFPL